jgi:hypothetical protein
VRRMAGLGGVVGREMMSVGLAGGLSWYRAEACVGDCTRLVSPVAPREGRRSRRSPPRRDAPPAEVGRQHRFRQPHHAGNPVSVGSVRLTLESGPFYIYVYMCVCGEQLRRRAWRLRRPARARGRRSSPRPTCSVP